MLDSLGPPLRQKCLSVLCKICGRQALLPRSLRIPVCYDRSDDPLYTGGFADVWMGEYQGTKVAVKVLRVSESSDFDKITSVGRCPRHSDSVGGVNSDCIEILQGGHDVEKSPPSKRAPIVGSDDEQQALCNDIGVDGSREH